MIRLCLTAVCLFQLMACSGSASKRYDDKAKSSGLSLERVTSGEFGLTLFANFKPAKGIVNIYLEGDGQPFFRSTYINSDPTSRQATALRLIRLDSNSSVLIGRPCYHLTSPSKVCRDGKWWTSHRYSEVIVFSLNEAIDKIKRDQQVKYINLIGFSGGGSLATLLAQRRTDVKHLVTISANLDIDQWTTHNRYTNLFGSLNPIHELDKITAKQLHLIGSRNTDLGYQRWLNKLDKQSILILADHGHACCWEQTWPKLLYDFIEYQKLH